jgi:vacuolar-type H+-ATPase subunit H
VDLLVDNKTGVPDATVIDLNKFHVDLGGNPIDAVMHVSTPVSDANINAKVMAKINLATIKDIVPLEKGDDLNGMITADIKMKGRMSSIEKGHYDEFDAQGKLAVLDMNYHSKSMSYPAQISALYLDFNPRTVDLTKLDARLGKSDIQMDGKIENFLQYALKDSLLKGSFNLRSSLLDLNELMSSPDTTKPAAAATPDTAKTTVTVVPSNLDIRLNANVAKMLYDKLTISNVTGGIAIKDSKMTLDNLKLAIDELEGTMALTGVYNTQNVRKPIVDFNVNIANFDIPKTFKAFNSVKKLAPIAQFAKGKFSTDMKFTTALDEHMDPLYNTLTGGGHLRTNAVSVEGFEPINKLADALHQEKYKKLAFDNIDATYEFKDGRVEVKEMPIKSGNITAKVKGSTGFDQTIDYTWNMEIPRAEFGAQANAAAGSILDQINKAAGTNVKMGDKIKIKALFGGTITKPVLKTDLFGSGETPKETVKEVIGQGIDMAKQKAREEAEKIMKDAQEQADKIKADAKALADKTKTEGYAAIDKNIEDIKNPIAKGTAKLAAPNAKKEVDKQAQKILDEANKKADDVLIKAKAESDKKLQ